MVPYRNVKSSGGTKPIYDRHRRKCGACERTFSTDRRLSVYLVSQTSKTSTVHEIVINNLQIRKVCVKLMSKVLTDDQRSRRLVTCQELWNSCESGPHFLDKVITGDESRVFEDDPETKRQVAEWHTLAFARPMKAGVSESTIEKKNSSHMIRLDLSFSTIGPMKGLHRGL